MPGIHCHGCGNTIQGSLEAEDGFEQFRGDVGAKPVHVVFRPEATSVDHIESALEPIGTRIEIRR